MARTAPDPEPVSEYATVYELMGQLLGELPAIGKNQYNSEQKFAFRGYDDVLNALNPLMSERGVFIVPDVIERDRQLRQTRSGGTMYEVNLHVRFTVYGPAGDSVSGSAWGEGTDMGDKATNKAMTNALKYFLFQTFAISTEEASQTDADRYTPEETAADVLYCRVCSEAIDGARMDREKMRGHLVDEHGWVRLADGSVTTADKAAALEAGQQDKDAEAGDVPAAAPSTVGTTPGDNPPADVTPTEDVAWVDELKGADLVATGKSYGVSVSGKVQDIRQRIKDAIAEGVDPTAAAATDDAPAQPATDDAAEPAADPAPDAPAEPTGDEDGATSGGDFACPDCTESFPTEAEYFDHWYAAHDDSDGVEATDTGDDPAALIQTVKDRIAGLSGEAARAYGKYRRDAKLPRPDEMTADQCTALIEFLDGLGAATG